MGRIWLIRETELEILHPLHFGDTVQVRTWVADWSRVRSRRAYEFCRDDTATVARASTDWAFLDTTSGRPAAIPAGMMAGFFLDGLPPQRRTRRRLPAAPPPPAGLAPQRRRVEWRDLDPAGHVNNAVYLAYAEACAAEAIAVLGWPQSRLAAAGLALVASEHGISYQQQALPDDELEVLAWFSGAAQDSIIRHAMVRRLSDGAGLARLRSQLACVDAETGGPAACPEPFLLALRPRTAP